MGGGTIAIIAIVGLVVLLMFIRFFISAAVNKGTQAIENAVARGKNARSGPEVVALKELYPEIAAQVLAQNGGVASTTSIPSTQTGRMTIYCPSCGTPGEGNFCAACGTPLPRQSMQQSFSTSQAMTQIPIRNVTQSAIKRRRVGSGKVTYVFLILVAAFGLFLTIKQIRPTIFRIKDLEISIEAYPAEPGQFWYPHARLERDMLLGTYPIMIAAGLGYILMCVTRKRLFALAVPFISAAMLILFTASNLSDLRNEGFLFLSCAALCLTCVVTVLYLVFDKIPIGLIMIPIAFGTCILILLATRRNQLYGYELMYMHTAGNAVLMFILSIANKRRKRYLEQMELLNEK